MTFFQFFLIIVIIIDRLLFKIKIEGNMVYAALVLGIVSMLKVDNRNTRARCKMCSKLTIKTPE